MDKKSRMRRGARIRRAVVASAVAIMVMTPGAEIAIAQSPSPQDPDVSTVTEDSAAEIAGVTESQEKETL